jgi:hypothetical protein
MITAFIFQIFSSNSALLVNGMNEVHKMSAYWEGFIRPSARQICVTFERIST